MARAKPIPLGAVLAIMVLGTLGGALLVYLATGNPLFAGAVFLLLLSGDLVAAMAIQKARFRVDAGRRLP